MAKFLHGVEVLEIGTGPRPIQTVRSSVVGIVGTAPDAAGATPAELQIGTAPGGNGIVFTAVEPGTAGNNIRIRYQAGTGESSAEEVTVDGNDITVTLATDAEEAPSSTAQDIVTAINDGPETSALVTAALAGDTGDTILKTRDWRQLAGGAAEPFPLNTPTLIAGSRTEAADLGNSGTLRPAMDGIFDQIGAVVVVVRVEEGEDEQATTANVIGGVNAQDGNMEGLHALAAAESVVGFSPRILLAPGFTHQREEGRRNAVVSELIGIAERMRAVILADGPDTTDDAAQQYADDFGSDRIYLTDPWCEILQSDGSYGGQPMSPRVAGIIAMIDNDRGFWWSPSNSPIVGIVGTTRPVDFKLGDANSRANLLNEGGIATVIRQDGYRLWGNRSLTDDTKWMFLSVRRTADMINDSIQRAHLWAVDRNITTTYVEDVTDGVNAYLDGLKAEGAILGGRCWPDPDLNTPANVQLGKVFFNFDFTPPYPAEHITFRSMLTNGYIEEVFQ